MAAKTITSLFYSRGGFTPTDSGSKTYVAPADVKDTYIPQAMKLANDLLAPSKVLTVTFSEPDGTEGSTGDLIDDSILAEFACYFRDLDYGTRRYDPETKQMANRHKEEGMAMLLDAYGLMNDKGKVVAPCYVEDSDKAYSGLIVTNGSY